MNNKNIPNHLDTHLDTDPNNDINTHLDIINDTFLSVKESAICVSKSIPTIRKLIKDKKLPFIKVKTARGNAIRIKKIDLLSHYTHLDTDINTDLDTHPDNIKVKVSNDLDTSINVKNDAIDILKNENSFLKQELQQRNEQINLLITAQERKDALIEKLRDRVLLLEAPKTEPIPEPKKQQNIVQKLWTMFVKN